MKPNDEAIKKAVTAKQMTPPKPASGYRPNWVPNATTRGLGAWLPGLKSIAAWS